MKKLVSNNWEEETIETSFREVELVEEFLDVNDYEESNSLIRMEMNVIEFPIFSKNPRVKKNQILKYYFSKDKQSFLEITPPVNESIPSEFDERIFISLLKVMKKKGKNSIFYCSLSEVADNLNVSESTKRGLYAKIRNSILKLSKTNYSFFNLFYLGSLNGKVNDLINTPLITSRIITLKEAVEEEKNLFTDRRIKEIYRIRIADDIYGNITNKGYLVFDADVLLNIKDPIVRSLYTQITKWRHNSLYLKKPLIYIAKKIPLSLKGVMIYSTSKKINESLLELKNHGLINNFRYLKGDKIEKSEFEIFFSEEHNLVKQKNFYQDKEDYNNMIHSVEERQNDIHFPEDNNSNISEIMNIFGPKGSSLKTLPNVIKESLKIHDFDYIKYTAEYTMINAKISLLKYFKEALANNWADEYISKQKVKGVKKKEKELIEDAIVIEKKTESFTWMEFEALTDNQQMELTEIAYKNFLKNTGDNDTKTSRGIFEKTKRGLITGLYSEFIKIKQRDKLNALLVKEILNSNSEYSEEIEDTETKEDRFVETKQYASIAKFTFEFYLEAKKENPSIELKDIATMLDIFGEYEDECFLAVYSKDANAGGYKRK